MIYDLVYTVLYEPSINILFHIRHTQAISRNAPYNTVCLNTFESISIGTVNISGPRAAFQRRRRKCGSLTGRVGWRFLCTSATLWPLARPLKSALVQARKGFGTQQVLRNFGRETHICVRGRDIDSDNGLLPVRCQVIIWTNAGLILTGPLGTYLN